MRKYCEECGREVETKVITKKEAYDVCGESIEVDAKILVCAECGEEFYVISPENPCPKCGSEEIDYHHVFYD